MKEKIIKYGTMGSYLLLYVIVAIVSLISSIHFFNLAHQGWMSTVLACSFEIGQMSCLFGALTRKKKGFDIVWVMFVALTLFQCMANTYAAYVGLTDYISWSELFGLNEMEIIDQKRIIAGISGAILPLIALGFIKCLTDYINVGESVTKDENVQNVEHGPVVNDVVDLVSENVEESHNEDSDETYPSYDGNIIQPLFDNRQKRYNEFEGVELSDDDIVNMEKYGKTGGISKEKSDMQSVLEQLKGYNK